MEKTQNEQLYYKDYFQLKMGQLYQVQYFSVDSLLSLNEINMRLKTLILFLENFKKILSRKNMKSLKLPIKLEKQRSKVHRLIYVVILVIVNEKNTVIYQRM